MRQKLETVLKPELFVSFSTISAQTVLKLDFFAGFSTVWRILLPFRKGEEKA